LVLAGVDEDEKIVTASPAVRPIPEMGPVPVQPATNSNNPISTRFMKILPNLVCFFMRHGC